MPRRAPYRVAWRPDAQAYVVEREGAGVTGSVTPDGDGWLTWLDGVVSFAFESKSGAACTMRKETVQRGGAYWYAYRRTQRGMVKRYVGRGAHLTLARMEEVAEGLNGSASAGGESGRDPAQESQGVAVADGLEGRAHDPELEPEQRRSAGHAGSAGEREAAPLLLATKLHMPRAAAPVVSRPHVLQRLERGLERPLTLVVAPAGFGKTAAVRARAQASGRSVAWVSLDASDNDPIQFWTYALTAFNQVQPGVAETPLAMLQTPQPSPFGAALRVLLNALAALPQDVVLVLDDYHLITAPAIHEGVSLLLEHPPAQLHLYLTARSEPPLPLARLRAYDQVSEIRADDLRFRPDEVAAFLGEVIGVQLASEDVMRLAERTDGWVAGLQLAGLSLRGHPDPARFVASFSGSHRHVLTYLGEEVLGAQPEDVQAFLIETSVLERMCGPLCDAVTGRSDGQVMLERLEQANLFVVPLDDEGRWYRYHHLFAELLRHRLRQERGGQIPELHRRAARWLEGEGWIAEAVEHLFAVPDAAEAARVIERRAEAMLTWGEVGPLVSLMDRLPEEVIADRPKLALAQATALFFYGELGTVERRIADVERGLRRTTAGAERALLAGELAGAKATLAMMRGDPDGAIAHAHEALSGSGQANRTLRGRVSLPLGIAYLLNGRMREANAALDEASRLSLAEGNLPTAIIALNMRALVLEQQGRLHQAAEVCRQAIHMTETQGGPSRALAATVYGELGAILYEWNDLVGARLALEKTIALGQQWANGQDQVDGYVRLALVCQAQGQATAALEAMRQAEQVLEHVTQASTVFPWVWPYVPAVGARLALRQRRLEQAVRWAEGRGQELGVRSPTGTAFLWEFEELTLARVLIAQDKVDEAMGLLEGLLRAARAEDRAGGEIEIRALQGLIWQAQGRAAEALDALGQALALAAPEGYVRVFVDEGAPMRALLTRLRERQPRGSRPRRYADTLLVAFDRGRDAAGWQPEGQALAEPLSNREREVLGLLAEGRSNQEIARRLMVEVSTVKTHMHHLYAKLGATDRLQAVTRARELGLLEG